MASDAHLSDAASDASFSSAASFASQRQGSSLSASSHHPHFWKLPRELLDVIIALACGPPSSSSRHSIIGHSFDDTTTILSLVRTSRFFYAQAIPLLYANVRVTRPSVLLSFQQSLAARPSLGRMVKRLHIGADQALPDHWLPLSRSDCGDEGHRLFRLNLGGGSSREPGSWLGCEIYEYHYDELDGDDAKANALGQAIKVAAERLDVSFHRQERNNAGGRIDSDLWHVRILELQAAMELYLLELQRYDKMATRKPGKKKSSKKSDDLSERIPPPYPRLRIYSRPTPIQGKRSINDVFQVTRAQLLQRMSSPGSPTDSFNHPLIFARSGLDWSARGPDGREYRGNNLKAMTDKRVEAILDIFAGSQASAQPAFDQSVELPLVGVGDPLNLGSSSTATIGGSLTTARCILALTPHVRSLSLTGVFERILTGERASSQQLLESVTLGPVAPGWAVPIRLTHAAMANLKRLRICGSILIKSEIACIMGENGHLAHLSTFQWSMPAECRNDAEPGDEVKIIQQLAALTPSTTDQSAVSSSTDGRKRKRIKATHEQVSGVGSTEEDDDTTHDNGCRALYIEAYLHPNDVDTVLAAAPTSEVASAWQESRVVPGVQHRLQVATFEHYHDAEEAPLNLFTSKATQALYDQGRIWWEGG